MRFDHFCPGNKIYKGLIVFFFLAFTYFCISSCDLKNRKCQTEYKAILDKLPHHISHNWKFYCDDRDTILAMEILDLARSNIDSSEFGSALLLTELAKEMLDKYMDASKPAMVTANVRKALALFNLNRYEQAQKLLNEAWITKSQANDTVDLESVLILEHLGLIYLQKCDFERGMTVLEKAKDRKVTVTDFSANHYATVLGLLSDCYYNARKPDSAVISNLEEAYRTSIQQFDAPDPRYAAGLLYAGKSQAMLGNIKEALSFANDALRIYQRDSTRFRNEIFDLLQLKFDTYLRTPDLEACTKLAEQALAWSERHAISKSIDLDEILYSLGEKYIYVKDFASGLKYLEKAVAVLEADTIPDKCNQIDYNFHAIGVAYRSLGDFPKAELFLNKALNMRMRVVPQNKVSVGVSYLELARLDRARLNFAGAATSLEIALQLFRDSGSKKYILSTLSTLGGLHNDMKYPEKALSFLGQAMKLCQDPEAERFTPLYFPYILQDLGIALRSGGNYESANQRFNEGLKYIKSQNYGRTPLTSDFHAELAQSKLMVDEVDMALNHIHKALTGVGFRSAADLTSTYQLTKVLWFLKIKAYIHERKYQLDQDRSSLIEADKTYGEAFQLIEHLKKEFQQPISIQKLIEDTYVIFEGAMRVKKLMGPGDNIPNELFQLCERAKSNLLRLAISDQVAKKVAGIPEKELEEEAALKRYLAYIRNTIWTRNTSDKQMEEFENELFELEERYRNFLGRLESTYPLYFDLKYNDEVVDASFIQDSMLLPDQALVSYFLGDSSMYIFAVRQDDFIVKTMPIDIPLDTLIKGLKPDTSFEYWQANWEFYQKVFLPIRDFLPPDKIKKLIIVPDAALALLPFEVLLTKEPSRDASDHAFLLEDYIISYAYSATMLNEMQSKQQKAEKKLLTIAPIFDEAMQAVAPNSGPGLHGIPKKFLRLINAEEEAKNISQLVSGSLLLGAEATKMAFMREASNYSMLHLSTHGLASAENGINPMLLFVDSTGRPEPLYAWELYNLQLSADMVVLSACETGIGDLQRGEGVISLARGFAYAGAKSIVTTLWEVNARDTRFIMVDFYKYLNLGHSKDEALQKAKLDYLRREGSAVSPDKWAGIISIGDMTPLEAATGGCSMLQLLGILLTFLLLLLFFLRYRIFSKNQDTP